MECVALRKCSKKYCKTLFEARSPFKQCAGCRGTERRLSAAAKLRKAKSQCADGRRICSHKNCANALPEASTYAMCSFCRELRRTATSQRRKRCRAAGLCQLCKRLSVGNQVFCEHHAIKMRISGLRHRARQRKLEVHLTDIEIESLVLLPCFYCGLKGNPVNGVDRVDSSLGYSLSNSCTACWECNRAKGTMTMEYFFQSCCRTRLRWLTLVSLGGSREALLNHARTHTVASKAKLSSAKLALLASL